RVLSATFLTEHPLAVLRDTERGDISRIPGSAGAAVDGPVLWRQHRIGDPLDRNRFLRVREEIVAVDEHRIAPLVGEMEGELHELDTLADVVGREHDVPVVAVPTTARRLVVVLLTARHV